MRCRLSFVLLALLSVAARAQLIKTPDLHTPGFVPTFRIAKPTVIAFCPLSEKDLKTQESIETFSSFAESLSRVTPMLRALDVDVQTTYERSFYVQGDGLRLVLYSNAKRKCGYYFVDAARAGRAEPRVLTDDEVVAVAKEYFGLKPR